MCCVASRNVKPKLPPRFSPLRLNCPGLGADIEPAAFGSAAVGGEEIRKQVSHLLVRYLRGEVLGHQGFAGAREILNLASQDGVLGALGAAERQRGGSFRRDQATEDPAAAVADQVLHVIRRNEPVRFEDVRHQGIRLAELRGRQVGANRMTRGADAVASGAQLAEDLAAPPGIAAQLHGGGKRGENVLARQRRRRGS